MVRADLPHCVLLDYLGISRDAAVLAMGPFPMRSADVLLMATDDLMDMNAPDGTLFGKERCFQIIQDHRHEPAERIVDRSKTLSAPLHRANLNRTTSRS